MAVRRRMAALADLFLKSHLQQNEQTRQYDLQRQNQDAAAKQAQSYRILDAGLQDPTGNIFDKLKHANITQLGGQDISGLVPTMDDAVGGVSAKIQAHPDQWDPLSIINAVKAAPGGVIDPNARAPIENLIQQRNQAMELRRNSTPRVSQKYIDMSSGAPVPSERYINPEVEYGPAQTGLTGAQAGSEKLAEWQGNEGDPFRLNIESAQAGNKAGAEAAAQFPYQQKLAQTRADMALANQEELARYRREHPNLTQEQINRHDNASTALNTSMETRQLLDEMEKRNMMGPISGRSAEIASGKIKAESLFPNPEDAQLASEYFSNIKLLTSLAAKVHSGLRGAGSPGILKYWQGVLSGVGDKSIVTGQLNAVDRIMQKYKDDPNAPPEPITIPGASYQNPTEGVDPSIIDLLNR